MFVHEVLSINQSNKQLFNQSINQIKSNQINQSNKSVNQSVNQSINQSIIYLLRIISENHNMWEDNSSRATIPIGTAAALK